MAPAERMHGRGRFVRRRPGDESDIRARLGQGHGGRRTEAAGRAGDERALAGQAEGCEQAGHGRNQARCGMATGSMSAKSWFSPPIPQTKE